jgi:hypothetical protein
MSERKIILTAVDNHGKEYPYETTPQQLLEQIARLREENATQRLTIDVALKEVAAQTESKNTAYKERNALVCALSKIFPSHLMEHSKDDASWDDNWRTIVCIEAPLVGQLTWHIHKDELPMFERHLAWLAYNNWDGHTTEEKYRRLASIPYFEVLPATYRTFKITGIDAADGGKNGI